jgi:hypothetical protein
LATSFLCGEELRNGKGDGEGKMEIEILKWPKHEIFGSRVFMQSKPEWVGDSGT